jgi:hypothetical protein
MQKLVILYPHPADAVKFETEYVKHLKLLHEKAGIHVDEKPYSSEKFGPSPDGFPVFYRMFSMPFGSPEALQATMSLAGMQEVVADARRISTGGPLIVLIATEA